MDFSPDQAPDAKHEDAWDDDHNNEVLEPITTELGLAEKLITGALSERAESTTSVHDEKINREKVIIDSLI